MALFELTSNGALDAVPATNFAAQQILERADLQRALKDRIEVLGNDLLVVAEEFGDFADVRRRIDLLCVDREGQLVVVELKRTEDGGHMDLQAIRYAAMVSTMTFDQLAATFERFLLSSSTVAAASARSTLAEFLEDVGGEDTVLQRRVRIILVAGGFDTQITTTVLWLNELYGLSITCVRLTPYRVDDRLLLDVQQVIPLPEAEELMVRLRMRESAAQATSTGGADWTQYVITSPTGDSEPLRKRRAILAMVHALSRAGVPAESIEEALPGPKFLAVDGVLTGDELANTFVQTHPQAHEREKRWFLDSPVHEEHRTWVLSKMWGTNTEPTLAALALLAPDRALGYRAVAVT